MPNPDGKIMRQVDFISRTSVPGRSRSPELQAIDRLLSDGESNGHLKFSGNFEALRKALLAWQKKEGAKWEESSRNKRGAISELEGQLFVYQGPQTLEDSDASSAREGILYLFSNTRANAETWKFVAGSGLDILGKATSIKQVKDFSKSNVHAGRGATAYGVIAAVAKEIVPSVIPKGEDPKAPAGATPEEKSTWEEIKEALIAFGRKIYQKVVAKVKQEILNRHRNYSSGRGAAAYQALNDLWAPIEAAIKGIIGRVAEKLVPIAGSAFQALKGVKKMCEAIYDRYSNYVDGEGVEYKDGHPAVIVAAINRAMNLKIGAGIFDTAKGAALTAVSITAAGALAVVEIIAAAAEMITLLIYRIVEIGQINAFCEDCRERWAGRSERSSIHNNPVAFKKWFGAAVMTTPAIAALALTSHVTGDKMQYLKLFNDDADIVSQAAFDRGVVHLDQLKAWSYKYLNSTGYAFYSDNPVAAKLLAGATNTDFKPHTAVYTSWQSGAVKQKRTKILSPFASKTPVYLPGSGMGGHRGFG